MTSTDPDHPDATASGWELVGAAQRGDRAGFAELYRRYQPPVYGFVLSRTRDRTLAEDLTSETFLRAWRRIDTVHDQGQGRDVVAWLVTIARNLVYDHLKSSRHRCEVLTDDPTAGAAAAAGGAGAAGRDPVQAVLDAETATALAGWVARLSPAGRECLRLWFTAELSIPETAAVTGRTENAVKSQRHRTLTRLARIAATHPDPTVLGGVA